MSTTTIHCWIHGGDVDVPTPADLNATFDYWDDGNGFHDGAGIRAHRAITNSGLEHCDTCHDTAAVVTEVTRVPAVCSCMDDRCSETIESSLCERCDATFKEWALGHGWHFSTQNDGD